MNASTKFGGFALGIAAVFGIALTTGAVIGPDPAEPAHNPGTHNGSVQQDEAHSEALPGGMMATDRGYTLRFDTAQAASAPNVPLRFRILDQNGTAVTRYVRSHEKDLHLIVVRRDMVAFQHVHPVLGTDGTWSVPLDLTRAGDYRVFADFTPEGGDNLTLGADLRVAGKYDPQQLPAATTTATVGDYTVMLNGIVVPGRPSTVTLSVRRGGKPVTDLQPYLGAYGHLVALRAADLGYLHVHPEGHPGDGVTPAGPGITFALTAPSAGDYRLFLDFQHEGVVRTAEFTLTVQGTPAADTATHTEHTVQQPVPGGHSH
ncbi:hypothetical protein [Nocardia amamiensis]|uniref:hypothetical protein n=1 Tax=Nocardia amamiensis TaxID=404578 RepID=UPI000835F8C1|nr:hypothetical protein [Nocardia amamiensis]